MEVEELAPARVPEAASDAQIAAALAQEGERILAQIPSSAYGYAMCIEAKQRGSEPVSYTHLIAAPLRFVIIVQRFSSHSCCPQSLS